MSSPASAPSRRSARSGGTSPITVTEIASGPRLVSPPISSTSERAASRKKPCANAAIHFSSASGSAIARVAQRGSAPIAARSERLTASALCPSLPGSASGKKWRPASSMSVETASVMPSRGWSSAQSSPTPSTAVGAGRVKYFRMMSNSEATGISTSFAPFAVKLFAFFRPDAASKRACRARRSHTCGRRFRRTTWRARPPRAPWACDRARARSAARAHRRARSCPGGGARSTWSRPCRIPWIQPAGPAGRPRRRPRAATRTGPAARARASGAAPISFVALGDVLAEVRHLHRDLGAVPALLRGARLGLLLGVGGEDAVRHRDAAVQLHLREARGRFVRDDVEMTGLAAYDRAERDQGVVLFSVGEPLQGERRLERARHRNHRERRDAELGEPLAAGLEHRDADSLVEARAHDTDPQALPAQVGLDLRHQESRVFAAFSA